MNDLAADDAHATRTKWKLLEPIITGSRRIAAVLAFVVVATAVIRSYTFPDARVCRDAADSTSGLVTLCGPVGLEDVPALAVLVLIGVLALLPDMSEVSIPGLVTLKRAVQAQTEQTKELATHVAALSLDVRQSQRQNQTVILYPPDPAKAREVTEELGREIESKGLPAVAAERAAKLAQDEIGAVGPLETGVSPPSAERAQLESEVIRLWQGIESVLPPFRRPPSPRDEPPLVRSGALAGYDPRSLDWWYVFEDEVAAFRAIRNTVAHAPGNLTDDQLREGVALGRELLKGYRQYVPIRAK